MKFFASLAAATLAAASLATPAQAYVSNGLITKAQRGEIGRTLKQGGVDLIFVSYCSEKGLAGIYNHERMTLKVCEENIDSGVEMDTTIAHEMVHATQHCVGSIMGVEGLLPIHTLLAQSDPDQAHEWLKAINASAAPKSTHVESSAKFNGRLIATSIEREAYALENDPMRVLGLYRAACIDEDE